MNEGCVWIGRAHRMGNKMNSFVNRNILLISYGT